MEGVGARLGRSSSRYGTTTVFSGPVRKWKKDWVPVTPSSSSSSSNNNGYNSNSNHHHLLAANGSVNGNNGSVSHLRLFKWTPLSNKDNNNNNNTNANNNSSPSKDSSKDDAVSEEPPRRKFKYIPIAVLEEQKKEAEENSDDDSGENTAQRAFMSDNHDEKPDINDMPMEENQAMEENQTAAARQDLNVSTLDLSLGLTSHEEGEDGSDSMLDLGKDACPERASSSHGGT